MSAEKPMTKEISLTRFKRMLDEALARADWEGADICVDRLKSALMESVATGDAEHVAQIGEALADAGELFELRRGLVLEEDSAGMAWKLRADAGTAVLAARVRPSPPVSTRTDIGLREAILERLRQSNMPLHVTGLSELVHRDAPATSRMLKVLAGEGLVRQWKANGFRYNALTDKGRGRVPLSPLDIQVAGRGAISKDHLMADPLPKKVHFYDSALIANNARNHFLVNMIDQSPTVIENDIDFPPELAPFDKEPRKEAYVN
jgi:hypothetical protein